MTYWADNIKFIKDILDSKYKKIEDAIADVSETSEDSSRRRDVLAVRLTAINVQTGF